MSEAKHVFFSDLKFQGQYYASLVRSPLQSGRLVDVRIELPEGYFLFTAKDIPGKNSVEINGGAVHVLAETAVSYIGEPVGIVAGPDYEIAAALAEGAEVIIEDEGDEAENPAAEDASAVIELTSQKGNCSLFFISEDGASAPETQGSAESKETSENADGGEKAQEDAAPAGNEAAEASVASEASNNAGQEAKDAGQLVITETCVDISPVEYFYAEHLGAVARHKKDRIEIYAATLWPFHVKKTVSAALSIAQEKVAVTPTDIGANHDGRILAPSLAAAQAAIAAILCKKTVKLIFSRSEEFSYYSKTPPAKIKIKSAAAPDGKIKAMQADIEINPGSEAIFMNEIASRMTAASMGVYDIENSKTSVRFAKTNLPPMTPAESFGESGVFSAMETHMDILSSKLKLLPAEIRNANIADEKYSSIIDAVCKMSGFGRKYTAYESLNKKRNGIKDGPVRGIGLSLGYQGSGFLSAWQESIQYSVEITMETTGVVRVKCGTSSSSIKEIISTLASSNLGIEKSLIRFVDIAPDDTSFNGPDILSSNIAIIAPLVSKCCSSLQRQRFRQPLPITVKKTYKPARSTARQGGNSMRQNAEFVSFTPGACVAELELNPLDFSIKMRGVWIACLAGKLLDRRAAERTLKRTVSEAMARLACKTIKIEDGKFAGAARFGCSIPSFASSLEPQICFIDSKDIPCGLGGIAHNLLPGAYCSAIAQITRNAAVEMPADSDYLYNCFS